MAQTDKDPRKVGTSGIRGINTNERIPELTDEQKRMLMRDTRRELLSVYYGNAPLGSVDLEGTHNLAGTHMQDYGRSGYDEPLTYIPDDTDIQENRYNNQSTIVSLFNGIAKMQGTAAATFLSSFIGAPAGLFEVGKSALQDDKTNWSALWDNKVTDVFEQMDDWMNKNMPNYKSKVQRDEPWYNSSNLISMNLWADDFIKNAGFTVGAAASAMLFTGGVGLLGKSFGLMKNATKAPLWLRWLGALFSATGEGMIEAKNGVSERNKLEIQKFTDAMAPEYQALEEEENQIIAEYEENKDKGVFYDSVTGQYIDPAKAIYQQRLKDLQAKKQELDRKKQAGLDRIEQSGTIMGNQILLMNQVLLTASDFSMFNRGMSKSFENAIHTADVTRKLTTGVGEGLLHQEAKRVGRGAASRMIMPNKRLGQAYAASKSILREGSEEMNQQWIQSGSSEMYSERDVNDYWRYTMDQEAYRATTRGLYTWGQLLDRGFQQSWGDLNQWNQFLAGALMGGFGTYMPTKLFNQDKSKKWWDYRRYGEVEGGSWNEVKDYNEQYNLYNQNIKELNEVLGNENFRTRLMNFIGSTKARIEKDRAAKNNDKKTWKDEDDKEMVHTLMAFYRAGKLDDLVSIANEMGFDLTEEDINGIVRSTTMEYTLDDRKHELEEEKAGANSRIKYIDERLQDDKIKGRARKKLESEKENLGKRIEEINKAIEKINSDIQSGGAQTKYIGPYVDENGNRLKNKTNEDIKKELSHNADNLKEKVNSFLDSANLVLSMTGGNLTNEQEDNLIYLHQLEKDKSNRFQKIMANVRRQLPDNLLLKTDKTPEQLAKETTSSDLAFSVTDKTPKGYVEVDTSKLNDYTFSEWFVENVLGGWNIKTTLTQDEIEANRKAEEEEKNLSDEEKAKRKKEREEKSKKILDERDEKNKKEREEQLSTNIDKWIYDHVVRSLMKRGMSLEKALESEEWDTLINDINDAVSLYNDAGVFSRTFREYMANVGKVDKAKKKAADNNKKKSEKQAEEDEYDENDDEFTAMNKMMRGNVDKILGDAIKSGDKKKQQKATKAKGLKDGRIATETALDAQVALGKITEQSADDAKKLLASQADAIMGDGEENFDNLKDTVARMLDTDSEAMTDWMNLLDENARKALESGTFAINEVDMQERLANAKDAIKRIADSVEEEFAVLDQNVAMHADSIFGEGDTSGRENAVQRSLDKDKENNTPTPPPAPRNNDKNEPITPVNVVIKKETSDERTNQSGGESEALEQDRKEGRKGTQQEKGESGWHPWRSAASEVDYYGEKPWEPAPGKDPTGKKKQRYDAVRKKLIDSGAFQRRRNGGIVISGEKPFKVGFKVFADVNTAAGDFVVFITDEQGNLLGDLPSRNPVIEDNKTDVSMDNLYDFVEKEYNNASDDEKKNGFQSSVYSELSQTLTGKVIYQDERQSVKQLMSKDNSKPKFAIKTGENNMFTGSPSAENVDGVHKPLTGNLGQPYVLIPTCHLNDNTNDDFKYYAVPIMTMTVGEALNNNTLYAKILRNTLERIKGTQVGRKKGVHISDVDAHSLLEALLSVVAVHVNLDEGSNTKKELGIRVTTFERLHGQEGGVPYTIFEGKREDMDIDDILDKLSRFQINVSSSFINGGNAVGNLKLLDENGDAVDYNAMIAEVSNTNAAKPHTVNDWFTIKPLVKKGDNLEVVEEDDSKKRKWSGGVTNIYSVSVKIGDSLENWTVKAGKDFGVYDSSGVEITQEDSVHSKEQKDAVKIVMAEVFGDYHMKNPNKPYAVLIDGKSEMYYPKTKTFKSYEAFEKNPKYSRNDLINGNLGKDRLTSKEMYDILNQIARDGYEGEEEDSPMTIIGGDEEDNAQKALEAIYEGTVNQMGNVDLLDDVEASANELEQSGIVQRMIAEEDNPDVKKEMDTIKEQALKDGTFMKAPNGKPTNLTERQWLQVRTKAFKAWFGDWERVAPKNVKGNLINQNGEINWEYFEQILDAYHNSQPDSMFAKGRTTLATREEKHFTGEKNTLNHIKFVTQSMLDLFEGKFDADLPFVSEARASLQNQKDLMVLAAMFHDAAKPYRHGDIHGWESADILRDVVGIDYNNRLAEWAIRHHMAMPFSHKAEFNLSNPEAIEVARNMARDAKRIGIDAQTAINAFVLINAADIINGREITVEDNWAKKAKAAGSTKFGDDISVKSVLTTELKEKVDLLKKAFEDIKDENLGNPEQNYRNQSRFDYVSYPEGGRADGKLPYLSNVIDNGVSKVVDENGEPLVVYHGTLGEFTTFDFNKLGETTGLGYYTDHITGEKVPVDSSYAFFFTDNKNAARSYKNLAIWQQNSFRAKVYRNLQAVFNNINFLFTAFEGRQKQEQRNFINNVVSPYMGFDVLREANNLVSGKSTLTEEQRRQYAEKFKQIANKIEKLPDARSVSNQANNLESNKKDLQYLIDNRSNIVSNKPLDYFRECDLHISSGYGNRNKGEVYLTIWSENEKYYVSGLPNIEGVVPITQDNFDSIINEFKKGIAQNEENLKKSEKEGKYDAKGNILEVFLNIKNPLEHDYGGSAFPDKYKGGKYETAYVAARQVKKARSENKDGVVYRNVRDPFNMTSYGIFGPNQVKSATDNNGNFSRENNDIQKLISKEGKTLGFVHNGRIYLQKGVINLNLPMHEYTHVWDSVIKAVKPDLWKRGKELMKETKLWKDIAENKFYGKKWENEKKTDDELEDLIASEVHARLVGSIYEKNVKDQIGTMNTFEKIKKWLLDAFKAIAETFGMNDSQINELTLDDWKNMTIRDFMTKALENIPVATTKKQDVDHTAEVLEALDVMREESSHIHLVRWDEKKKEYVDDSNGDYYRDDRNGKVYARVSNVYKADKQILEAVEKAGWDKNRPYNPSNPPFLVGNVFDRFGRSFYKMPDLLDGVVDAKEIGKKAEEMADKFDIGIQNNMTKDTRVKLVKFFHQLKSILGKDWEIDSSGISAIGSVNFTGDSFVDTAGVIDLLAYNKVTGEYALVDMKTHWANMFGKDGKIIQTDANNATVEQWRAQQSLYRTFINTYDTYRKRGIKISKLFIAAAHVSYNRDNANFTVGEDGTVYNNGISININVLDTHVMELVPKIDTKYDVAQLPESVRRLMSGTTHNKPQDPDIPLKQQLNEIISNIPESRNVVDFLTDRFKDNQDAIGLCKNVEEYRGRLQDMVMSLGNQNFLMSILDTDAINDARNEEAAEKQGVSISIPATPSGLNTNLDDYIEANGFENYRDMFEKLSDDSKTALMNAGSDGTLLIRQWLVQEPDAEVDEMEEFINESISTRHKKAQGLNYTKINLPQELKWLDTVLPQISREGKLHIIEGLIRCSDGSEDYGRIKRGIMEISTEAADGTVYHEAFHYVLQFVLTDDEINSLYKAAVRKYGNMPDVALEERLADDFADYVKGLEPEESSIKAFFKKLWNAIKTLFDRHVSIDNLYRRINSGFYAGKTINTWRTNPFANVRSDLRVVARDYEYLTKDERDRVDEAGISQENFNSHSKEEKEYMLHCII